MDAASLKRGLEARGALTPDVKDRMLLARWTAIMRARDYHLQGALQKGSVAWDIAWTLGWRPTPEDEEEAARASGKPSPPQERGG